MVSKQVLGKLQGGVACAISVGGGWGGCGARTSQFTVPGKMPPPSRTAIFFGHALLPLCLWRGSMGSVSPCATDQTTHMPARIPLSRETFPAAPRNT